MRPHSSNHTRWEPLKSEKTLSVLSGCLETQSPIPFRLPCRMRHFRLSAQGTAILHSGFVQRTSNTRWRDWPLLGPWGRTSPYLTRNAHSAGRAAWIPPHPGREPSTRCFFPKRAAQATTQTSRASVRRLPHSLPEETALSSSAPGARRARPSARCKTKDSHISRL